MGALGRASGQPVPFRETNFDSFVRVSLRRALQGAEPSPAVWERIERHLAVQRDPVPGWALADSLWRRLLRVQHILFSSPSWQERLAEHRMQVRAQMITYPHVCYMPLVAV